MIRPVGARGSSVRSLVESLIEKAIRLYNKHRAPEAVAELLSIRGDEVVIRFTGSFCHTCGVDNWVEDMVYVMEDAGIKAVLEEYIEPPEPECECRIGVFRILDVKEKREKQNSME